MKLTFIDPVGGISKPQVATLLYCLMKQGGCWLVSQIVIFNSTFHHRASHFFIGADFSWYDWLENHTWVKGESKPDSNAEQLYWCYWWVSNYDGTTTNSFIAVCCFSIGSISSWFFMGTSYFWSSHNLWLLDSIESCLQSQRKNISTASGATDSQ